MTNKSHYICSFLETNMMRIVGTLLFLTCGCFFNFLHAQKTDYSFDLPEVGDVFYYKLDNLPDDLSLDFVGNRNAWNFSMLSAPTAHEYRFEKASSSIYSNFFPDAQLVSYDLWKNEKFYKKIGNGLFLLGEAIKSGREVSNPIIKNYVDLRPIYSMEYALGVPQKYDSKWNVVLNGSEIKTEGINPNKTYKIVVSETIFDEVTNQGLLFLPRERFENALKMVRTINSDFKVQESKGRNAWSDLDLNVSSGDLPFKIDLSKKEIVYLAEGNKEWLAHIELDHRNRVSSALFKSEKAQVRTPSNKESSQFYLYPNPTFGLVRLDFIDLPKDTYFLDVYNIIGKKIWSEKYLIEGYTTIKVDLGFLSKGTYLYSLSDKSGKKILTRKLAIINP